MTASNKVRKGEPTPPIPPMFLLDGEVMDVESRHEQWCEFILTDGTTIRLKPAVIEIRKLRDQFAPNGDPIYFVKSTVITDTKIPDNLKKKG